jgi:hypothetical protein
MANVPSQINRKVSSDRSRLGRQGLSLSQHLSTLFNDILSLPAHAYDRSRRKELSQSLEEWFFGQIGIMGFGHFLRRPYHFQSYQLVAAFFESGNDISYNPPLDTVGFDGQKGPFLVGPWPAPDGKGRAIARGAVGRCGRGCHGSDRQSRS